MVVCAASALSVAMLFYSWRFYAEQIQIQQKRMRERVAYMLWVMADRMPDCN
jgi:hypothetical protein